MNKLLGLVAALALAACADVKLATDYTSTPQSFPASIDPFPAKQLDVNRSAKHPGKLWVTFPPASLVAASWGERQTQWTAMLDSRIEPAYRAAALQALAADPGGACEITGSTPWPQQFAIEYSYVCH